MLSNLFTLTNLFIALFLAIVIYVGIKWGYFKHFLFKEWVIVFIALIISVFLKKILDVKQFNFGIPDSEEVTIVIIHAFLTSLVGFILLFIIVYWKSIAHSFHGVWGKDYVLKIVARDFIDDVLNAHSKIKYTSGVKNITNGLETESGISLYTHHFVKLLSVSADLRPDIILGCWNTTWYPLDEIFKLSVNNKLSINEEWTSYFMNLEKAYNRSKKNSHSRHKRIFIVDNPEKVIDELKDHNSVNFIYWFTLLKMHKDWNVHDFYFISKKELEEKIKDVYNSHIPNYRDFAIFIKNGGFGFKKYWCFAQETEPTIDGISNAIYSKGADVKKVKQFFFDENRWQSRIHIKIEGEKLILINENGN